MPASFVFNITDASLLALTFGLKDTVPAKVGNHNPQFNKHCGCIQGKQSLCRRCWPARQSLSQGCAVGPLSSCASVSYNNQMYREASHIHVTTATLWPRPFSLPTTCTAMRSSLTSRSPHQHTHKYVHRTCCTPTPVLDFQRVTAPIKQFLHRSGPQCT